MQRILVLAVLLLGTNCFADSLGIFEIDGILRSLGTNNIVGTFAGTIEIDTTTGSIVSYDIPMPGNLGLPPLTFTPSNSHLSATDDILTLRWRGVTPSSAMDCDGLRSL
jgi:hypothetical protein